MFNLFNNAINAVKNFLGGNHSAPKPAPRPAPRPAPKAMVITKLPTIAPISNFPKITALPSYNPYIARWGDSPATIAAGQARNNVQAAAYQEQMKRQADEFARAEAERRKAAAQAAFNKTRDQFAAQAKKNVDSIKQNEKGNFWSAITGGFVGDNAARDYAQKRLNDLEKNQTKRYDDKLNSFLKEQARRKAEIENAKFKSQAEFDQAKGLFTNWEKQQIDDLEYMRAATTGMMQAYGQKSQEKGNSFIAKVGQAVSPITAPIWKYTLGEGDQNVPSLFTAPSRVINTVGNMFDPNRQINKYDGSSQKGLQGKNAWQASFEQRNFNIGNASNTFSRDTAIQSSYENALAIYKSRQKPTADQPWYKGNLPSKQQWLNENIADTSTGRKVYSPGTTREKVYFTGQGLEAMKTQADVANNTMEFFADPWFLAGGAGKVVSGSKWLARGSEALKGSKLGTSAWSLSKKVTDSGSFKWLNAEAKNPDQQFFDALKTAKDGTSRLQNTVGRRINEINKQLAIDDPKAAPIDTSVLEDMRKLTDKEAAMLQRMKAGQFGTLKDRLQMRDIPGVQYSAPQREKLLSIYHRWTALSEQMKAADRVITKNYGAGKRFYSPVIDYTNSHSIENYNFHARKLRLTHQKPQLAQDLARNATDRYFMSTLDSIPDLPANSTSKLMMERASLAKLYKTRREQLKAPVMAADAKRGTLPRWFKQQRAGQVPTTSFGRSAYNSAHKAVSLPTKLWKKSVLTLRPAWTVNNVLYNTQAAGLAGGSRALLEQARMLRPRNWKQAMQDIPDGLKADLTGEIGKGRLNKFYNNVENWSRVAAYRGAKANGYTDQQALQRVNKYLFDYKTKNWERPLKTVMPFWAWNKNLTKAAVNMPFDRPVAAAAYNKLDQVQNSQFDGDFAKIVPKLEQLGYTPAEIQQIKDQNAKFYRGRLKVGNQYITTPFNAFSDKGLSEFGMNPYLAALRESATATDSFGRPLNGTDAKLSNRILSKFPQYELGNKAFKSWQVQSGKEKPVKGWIAAPGSEGYGLTKQRQGYDPTKKNYDRSMDPRAKLGQDALAFVGVPRGIEFNKNDLVQAKTLQKATQAYFALDTKSMSYTDAQVAQDAVFKKYGMTADQFYNGILAKYDTANTTKIKGLKQQARDANKSLFDQYMAQPKGSRNLWATNKLRELNAAGYFNDNPFKKSFDWINPTTVAKSDRQALYNEAKRTGDWSAWRKKFGDTRQVSAKKIAYDKAKKSGDWSAYRKQYGLADRPAKPTPHQFDGKFFKTAESMARYKEGKFWQQYAKASRSERKKLLLENPQFNTRKDWTANQWTDWKNTKMQQERTQYRQSVAGFAGVEAGLKQTATRKALIFTQSRHRYAHKVKWG